MKPGERVTLIKKLAEALVQLEWSDIDLTLRQFGFPWSEDWSGTDKYSYTLRLLEHGDDETLATLSEHVFPAGQVGDVRSAERLWGDGPFRLFMSHIASDKLFVAQVKRSLRAYGIIAFVAHEDIEPTKEWITEIELALETCHALVAFLTPTFHQSAWTDQEIGYCIKRRVLVVPIRMGLDPYGFIARYQALQGGGGTADDLAGRLCELLVGHDLTSAQMAEAVVYRFETSANFMSAKRNAELLERVKHWTPALLQRLELALTRNDQVSDAWGVPERVRAIIKRFGQ